MRFCSFFLICYSCFPFCIPTRNKQLVVVLNQAALGVGVNLGSGIVVKTHKKKEAAAGPAKAYKADEQGSEDSQKTDDSDMVETFSDWSILGANLITRGDKGFVVLTPTWANPGQKNNTNNKYNVKQRLTLLSCQGILGCIML